MPDQNLGKSVAERLQRENEKHQNIAREDEKRRKENIREAGWEEIKIPEGQTKEKP